MVIGDQLRAFREVQNLSQGDIEKRTGLLRCYISRVENGHTVPSIETLEKWARALEMLLYRLFYDGDESPSIAPIKTSDKLWGGKGKDARLLDQFCKTLSQTKKRDRDLLLHIARKLARERVA
jgi:transcriptional regulator with XRE-family HTH domain